MSKFDSLQSSAQGRLGGTYVAGTDVNTGSYGAIQALSDVTFTTLTGTITNGASMTISAGQIVYGYFTVVTLAGGTAILYNA